LLRIFSTKNELAFQGKAKTYTSNLREKYLVDKIKNKPRKFFINNISWIGLLINNALTISNKYIPTKISYLYNYLCKLCEIQFKPSAEFEPKYKKVIEKLIDFIVDFCFNNKIEDIFNFKITKLEEDLKSEKGKKSSKKMPKVLGDISKDKISSKEICDIIEDMKFEKKKKYKPKGKSLKDKDEKEDDEEREEKGEKEEKEEKEDEEEEKDEEEEEKEEEKEEEDKMENEINIIHYFVHLNEIVANELEEKDKKGYIIFDKKLRELSIDIEPSKNKLNDIYDNLIKTIKDEIKEEKEKRQSKEVDDLNKKIFGECEELQNDVDRYISKYGRIKGELPKDMFNKEVEDLLILQEKLKTNYGKDIFEKKESIKVVEINISKKYLIDDVKIIPNRKSGLDNMRLEKENLEKRKFYLPYNYYKSEMEVQKYDEKKKENKIEKITLKDEQEIKKINEEKVEKYKMDIQSKKKDIK
jgi:hypothetical protein